MIRKNIISVIIAVTVLVLSLADSNNFDRLHYPVIPHIDKIVHLVMYGALMFSLIIGNRKWLSSVPARYVILSVITFFYGLVIELIQKYFTIDRSGEIMDAVFNLIGIFLAVAAWFLFKSRKKSNIR